MINKQTELLFPLPRTGAAYGKSPSPSLPRGGGTASGAVNLRPEVRIARRRADHGFPWTCSRPGRSGPAVGRWTITRRKELTSIDCSRGFRRAPPPPAEAGETGLTHDRGSRAQTVLRLRRPARPGGRAGRRGKRTARSQRRAEGHSTSPHVLG